MVKHVARAVLILLGLLALGACAKVFLMEEAWAPQWVSAGSGSFRSARGKSFHGVGTAQGVQNRMLLRATADNTAREALMRLLERYSSRLIRSAMQASLPEEEIRQHAGLLARLNLRQAVISDHWQEPTADGRLYALCRLDLAVFRDNLRRYKAMDTVLRQAMLERVDEVHGQMAVSP